MIFNSHQAIHKVLAVIAVLVFPAISTASDKVCEAGKLPKAYRGTYIDGSTAAGTKVELTDSSNPNSVENGVLLKSESGNLVLIALNRMPTNDWPNRVSDLIRASAPAMVLQKVR